MSGETMGLQNQHQQMNSKVQLPPREKKLIVRKPDAKLSAEKRKLSSRSHTETLNISFVSLGEASPSDVFQRVQRMDSQQSLLLSRSRRLNTTMDLSLSKVQNSTGSGVQTPRPKRQSFNIKQVENTIQNLSEIKLYNDYSKVNLEKDSLLQQNRRLKKQVADLIKQKQINSTVRRHDEIARVRKEKKELEWQCNSLSRTISELESTLQRREKQRTHIQNLYDSASLEIEYLKSQLQAISTLNKCYQQTMDLTRQQNNQMYEQIKYLNISLVIKSRKQLELQGIVRDNEKVEQLKRKNKRLHKENNTLRRNRMMDDQLLELTPEKHS